MKRRTIILFINVERLSGRCGPISRSLLIVLAFGLAVALRAAPASPELTAKIDALFAKWDHRDTPGVVVAIARDGETIHARGYGMANLEHAIALSPETVSESGSVAKQFTAAAVVVLAQRGQLSLDDPVRNHLPELPATLAEAITVRMLLNHTSGLRDIHGLFDLIGRPSYSSMHTNAEVLQVVTRQRQLNFAPGAEYLYSNTGYILATLIVQRVSGQPFAVFCDEQLFAPRGMTQTRWRDDFAAIVPGRATGYAPRAAGGYRIDLPYSNLVGNGGLLTTVGDLLKWNASLDTATGEWADVVRALQTPSKLGDGRTIDYGLGLIRGDHESGPEISHAGSTSGYRAYLTRFPERRVSYVLLANTADFNPATVSRALTRTLLDLPARPRPIAMAVAPEAIAPLAGLYRSTQADVLLQLTAKNGRLYDGAAEWIPTAPRTFTSAAGGTRFEFDESDPRQVSVTTPNGRTTYTAVAAANPTRAQLQNYAGTYYSDELDVAHTVSASGGKLSVTRWPGPPLSGEPTFADGFWFSRAWHATFTRDANGQVNGYELTNGRCRRVKFVRR